MVLGEAARAERLAAFALETGARRVHEHEVELGEEIAPSRKQLFLDAVGAAAEQAAQHGEENVALEREAMPAGAGEVLHDLAATVSCH